MEYSFHYYGILKMLTKQYTILEPFTKRPWQELTFKQVKELAKNKSDNYVHGSLKVFVKECILKEKKIGNVVAYSLNNDVSALNAIGYISEFKALTAKHIPILNIKRLLKKIKTSYYTLIITGSYAKKEQKESSDLDIVIICDNKQEPNKILSQIRLDAEMMIPKIHPYVFRESQFFEMLVNKEENYGKEIARNNLIITGAKQYYNILMGAIEHGFNG